MRRVEFRSFGPPEVLRVVDGPKPEPRPKQVRIRVRATTVTAAEAGMRRGEPLWGRMIIGFTGPRKRYRTLGGEFAGVIDAVGRDVTRFREGDEVFGFAGWNIGANADWFCLPEGASIAPKPRNTSFGDAAAAVDGPTTAMFFLHDKARLRAGQRVLVIGASGSVGSYAVQLAKRAGAHVGAVCGSTNVALARSLGADEVIDYTQQDFAALDATWDVVFDTVGVSGLSQCEKVISSGGVFLPTAITPTTVAQGWWTSLFGTKRLLGGMSVEKNAALLEVRDLLEADALRVIVDRRLPLEEIVEAHRLVDSRRKKGNVVIEVSK